VVIIVTVEVVLIVVVVVVVVVSVEVLSVVIITLVVVLRITGLVHNWFSPSSEILHTIKRNVSETGPVSVFR
jgi:hypothetical protein